MRVATRTGPRPPGRVLSVAPGGIAEQAGLEAGDEVLSLNGRQPTDILDIRFAESEETVLLEFRKSGGEVVEVEIEKNPEDPLGIEFGEDLFDGIRTCRNNCPFCFVYQNPRRLRKSLYIKDEDYRYSFLHGNYMTLSNLSEEDWEKIFSMRLTPLYVSVHATDPQLRRKLLGTKQERPILEHLKRLQDGGIDFYGQIVSIPGWNDGERLEETLRDLLELRPQFRGLAVVPVGLTGHRGKLMELPHYEKETALAMVRHADGLGDALKDRHGERVLYLADEFYLMAGLPVPPISYYDGYLLREDGVGMIRKFTEDFRRSLPRFRKRPPAGPPRRTRLATGMAARRMFEEEVLPRLAGIPWLDLALCPVESRFYGGRISVAGLLAGSDYREQLPDRLEAGDRLLIPRSSLREDGAVFLDDSTPGELALALGVEVLAVADSAEELLQVLWGQPLPERVPSSQPAPEIAIYGG